METLNTPAKRFGPWSRKAINAITKPVNLLRVLVAFSQCFFLEAAIGQQNTKNDTIWGNGYLLVRDIETAAIIPGVQLTLKPVAMQMVVPDTTYAYTSTLISVIFKLPVYIDTEVGTNEWVESGPAVFPNVGNEINIFLKEPDKGQVSFFGLNGEVVIEKTFSGKAVYLPLEDLKTGMYVYRIKTVGGIQTSGKFLKQDVPLKGPAFARGELPAGIKESTIEKAGFNHDSSTEKQFQSGASVRNISSDYEATYWVRWEKQGYITDSMLITIHEGLNFNVFVFNIKSNITYLNQMVYIRLVDTTNGGVEGIDCGLFIRPDSLEMMMPDTVYSMESNDFAELPVFIDTIPDGIINGENFAARYWVKWTPALDTTLWGTGHYTDSCLVTITEETQFVILYAEPVPHHTPNQDLEGYVWKLEDTSQPIEGAQLRAVVNSTGAQHLAVSDVHGHFVISGLPLGAAITFDVGGVDGRYSFDGINYTTPATIYDPADSVNSNFGAVLPLKLASSSANHIRDQTRNGTNQDTIWFYQGNSVPEVMKNNNRTYFANLQSDENNVYVFAESFTPLNNTGINIEYGTYNTNTNEEGINTPIGGILYPVIYANTTMGNGSYIRFVHEIKRALGFDEVSWVGVESVMETPVQNYTQEDKDIAQFVERPYWNSVYQESKTWISLKKIVE